MKKFRSVELIIAELVEAALDQGVDSETLSDDVREAMEAELDGREDPEE